MAVLGRRRAAGSAPRVTRDRERRLARFHGADLRPHTRVEALSTAGGEVVLRTSDDRTIRAGELVVCARQWTRDGLAVLRERLNITVTREGVVYLEPVAPESFEIGG